MEVRRIMKLGRSSLVVSLPKGWVKLHGLKKGDVISMAVQRDGSLVLKPGAAREEGRSITLHVGPDEPGEHVLRRIIACYLNGYSTVHVVSPEVIPLKQQKAIRKAVERLYLRIMDATSKHVCLQSLLDESKVSLAASIRRMHSVASSMCKDLLKAIEERDVELAKVIRALDDDVDEFAFFMLRLLRTALVSPTLADVLGIKLVECLDYKVLVLRIEHVADHAASMARTLISLDRAGKAIPDDMVGPLMELGREAYDMYEKAVEAFLSGDVEQADGIIDAYAKIEPLSLKVVRGVHAIDDSLVVCAICSIRDGLSRIAEFAVDIAEAAINRSLAPA